MLISRKAIWCDARLLLVKTGSVPKKRQSLKARAIKTLFGIKTDEASSK
jgi:hypothetical protein